MPEDRTGYRISIVDEDPLRARKEARELLAGIAGVDPGAALDVPRQGTAAGPAEKGGPSADTIGLVISAGSLVAAGVQIWLARVPQRTIVVRRPDGATLHITGKEAREDDGRIERFLSGGGETPHPTGGDGHDDTPAAD
ncbi:effector-associated constant component EACC1 [Streptomyces prasinus]|uniref:effector-associated constant component EACC1 n=1 Tax=Streptomyces prasinus TaxID=67345 RepID=UPI00362DBEAF